MRRRRPGRGGWPLSAVLHVGLRRAYLSSRNSSHFGRDRGAERRAGQFLAIDAMADRGDAEDRRLPHTAMAPRWQEPWTIIWLLTSAAAPRHGRRDRSARRRLLTAGNHVDRVVGRRARAAQIAALAKRTAPGRFQHRVDAPPPCHWVRPRPRRPGAPVPPEVAITGVQERRWPGRPGWTASRPAPHRCPPRCGPIRRARSR